MKKDRPSNIGDQVSPGRKEFRRVIGDLVGQSKVQLRDARHTCHEVHEQRLLAVVVLLSMAELTV